MCQAKHFRNDTKFAPCKGIRIPESRNFLLVESGILGFGIRNPALGIRNPTKDWNPESSLLKIHSRLDWATRSKEKPSMDMPQRDDIQCNIGISGVKTILHELHMKGHGQRGNPCLWAAGRITKFGGFRGNTTQPLQGINWVVVNSFNFWLCLILCYSLASLNLKNQKRFDLT